MPEILQEIETEGINPELIRRLILFEYLSCDYHIRIPLSDEENEKASKVHQIASLIYGPLENSAIERFLSSIRKLTDRRIIFAMGNELSNNPEDNEILVPYDMLFQQLVDDCSDLLAFAGGPIDWDESWDLDLDKLEEDLEKQVL